MKKKKVKSTQSRDETWWKRADFQRQCLSTLPEALPPWNFPEYAQIVPSCNVFLRVGTKVHLNGVPVTGNSQSWPATALLDCGSWSAESRPFSSVCPHSISHEVGVQGKLTEGRYEKPHLSPALWLQYPTDNQAFQTSLLFPSPYFFISGFISWVDDHISLLAGLPASSLTLIHPAHT